MKTIQLSEADAKRLALILSDRAMEMEDDGNEGNPDAMLVWKLVTLLKA